MGARKERFFLYIIFLYIYSFIFAGCQIGEQTWQDGEYWIQGCHNYMCQNGTVKTLATASECNDK